MKGGSTPDERYFHWLYSLVADGMTRDPAESHWLLCERLYKTPFRWHIHNDKNRANDGLNLREDYLDMTGEAVPQEWAELDCSIFEMLIALANRASFQGGGEPGEWFEVFLRNVELWPYTDDRYHDAIDDAIAASLDRIMNREYEPSGIGGFFPLRDPGRDQREVEIWYQLSAYLLENIAY